jgi:hypothetical protein
MRIGCAIILPERHSSLANLLSFTVTKCWMWMNNAAFKISHYELL